jgi:hypothetical protein
LVRGIIAERMAGLELREPVSESDVKKDPLQDDASITAMLENLDIFMFQ